MDGVQTPEAARPLPPPPVAPRRSTNATTGWIIGGVALCLVLLFVVFLLVLQLRVGWPALYLVPNFLYLALLAAYVVLLFFGPNIDTLRGLEIQAVGQKIIVYASILNISIQAYGARAFFLRPQMQKVV